MEKNGYLFRGSDIFQKPLVVEFIPKTSSPEKAEDFKLVIENKESTFINAQVEEKAETLLFQKNILWLSKIGWLIFAVLMCVTAILALKTANYKFIFLSIGALFFSVLSDFLGTKFLYKKTSAECIKITLDYNSNASCIFIPIKGEEEDLSELFPDLVCFKKEYSNSGEDFQ